jgi:hypothetical protein
LEPTVPEPALRAVQFIHPGGEHRPDAPGAGIKGWNRGAHQRKFMRTAGTSCDAQGAAHHGEILLWGEWEPPSKVEEIRASGPSYPQYLHRAFLEPRAEFAGHQNTDPFVFGDEFLYTGCQQWRGKPHGNPVQLRYLLPGSLILFGSCAGDRFLLDTVFVVRDFIDHDRGDYQDVLRSAVPDAYWTVTLGPWYSGPPDGRSFRLYRGASPANAVNGMFSFFPCRPADGASSSGFPRPDLSELSCVNPRLRQGWHATKLVNVAEAANVWHSVRQAVLAQGCELGVRAAIPAIVSDNG